MKKQIKQISKRRKITMTDFIHESIYKNIGDWTKLTTGDYQNLKGVMGVDEHGRVLVEKSALDTHEFLEGMGFVVTKVYTHER